MLDVYLASPEQVSLLFLSRAMRDQTQFGQSSLQSRLSRESLFRPACALLSYGRARPVYYLVACLAGAPYGRRRVETKGISYGGEMPV